MIAAAAFVDAAREVGFSLYSGVPCSYLKPFINYVSGAEGLRYVAAANEGDAVAIAAGATLAGTRSAVMMQNSGFGNAVNPLTSLCHTARIPILLIVTWRGEPGGRHDEPQHELMGAITPSLLELLRIPWEPFPRTTAAIGPALRRALTHLNSERTPYALLMSEGTVEPYALQSEPATEERPAFALMNIAAPAVATRAEILRAVQLAAQPDDVLIATTGYTGRELYALEDRASQFYMVGSMGCVASIGLGIALAQPQRRVIVLDGDGAALMRLGALATIGYERPGGMLHLLLDNGSYESTGGQATVAPTINFCAIAGACGYERVSCLHTAAEVNALVADDPRRLSFAHVPITPGTLTNLPRPALSPPELTRRLERHLAHRAM
jgi:phosphonopyruvate decarboxylase